MHRRGFFGTLLAGVTALCGVRLRAEPACRIGEGFGYKVTPQQKAEILHALVKVHQLRPGEIRVLSPGMKLVHLGAGPDADAPVSRRTNDGVQLF